MNRKTHHVVPNSERGGWDIVKGGGEKSLKHFETKNPAVDYARDVSINQKSELLIHDKNGVIQQSDSHGNDPRNIKG